VIQTFKDKGSADVFNDVHSKVARRACPAEFWRVARRKLGMVNSATRLEDLRVPPHNRLEKLRGDRAGQHSIRVNDQYRVVFTWSDDGARDVEITDYH
jgi:proteic killer suppression protein